jgi:hypothetical protein
VNNMKKGDMIRALYIYIVGVALKGKGEPVSTRAKLLSTGDVEWMKTASKVSVAQVKKFLAGFLAKVHAGEAGVFGNRQCVPKGWSKSQRTKLTLEADEDGQVPALTYTSYEGKHAGHNAILYVHLSRSFSDQNPTTKRADTKPPTKKQRVTASRNTPAPKAGRINKKGPKSNGRLTQAQKVKVRAKFGPEWYNRSNANTIRDWARTVA